MCEANEESYCNDTVERTNLWIGLVGLMSAADIVYANGWLYDSGSNIYLWSISACSNSNYADTVCGSNNSYLYDRHAGFERTV